MKILIIDPVHASLMKRLNAAGFECEDASAWSLEQIEAVWNTIEGVVMRSRMAIDRTWIDRGRYLRFIARVGAGLEHIDQAYAREKGIRILSSPEGNRQAVAEHALGMLLSLFHKINAADRQVKNGTWERKINEGVELSGKVVGIIGYGNTGSAFAKVLRGFEVRVVAYDKYKTGFGDAWVEESSMEQVFQQADVVSLHLPMTQETNRLVNRTWIDRFKRPFYLINTSRGAIVDTADLAAALNERKVLGAGLDVIEYESEDLKLPDLMAIPSDAQALIQDARVIVTPHIAGLSKESYRKLSEIMAEKIIEHFGRA